MLSGYVGTSEPSVWLYDCFGLFWRTGVSGIKTNVKSTNAFKTNFIKLSETRVYNQPPINSYCQPLATPYRLPRQVNHTSSAVRLSSRRAATTIVHLRTRMDVPYKDLARTTRLNLILVHTYFWDKWQYCKENVCLAAIQLKLKFRLDLNNLRLKLDILRRSLRENFLQNSKAAILAKIRSVNESYPVLKKLTNSSRRLEHATNIPEEKELFATANVEDEDNGSSPRTSRRKDLRRY